MNIQAFSDLYKFESLAEQAHVGIRMRRVFEPEAGPFGPGLQRQNAMSYCDFREMKHMADSVLRKPRCAAILREWASEAAAGRSMGHLIEEAREIRKFLTTNFEWNWWWHEALSEAQAEVVCLILFRAIGMPSESCRRLVACEGWMVAYLRPKDENDRPLHRLLTYGAADEMPEEFIGDARVASDLSEEDFNLARRIVRVLPLCRFFNNRGWFDGVLTVDRLVYYLNEDEVDVERACNNLMLDNVV